eukprot:15444286-Alexandrium_andersonii.AAC.1
MTPGGAAASPPRIGRVVAEVGVGGVLRVGGVNVASWNALRDSSEASRYYAGHVPQGVCADCEGGCVPGLSRVFRECPGYERDPDI